MKKVLFLLAIVCSMVGCSQSNPCNRQIKQPSKTDSFKVYNFGGSYVVGQYEKLAAPNKDGVYDFSSRSYDTVFIRLVFDPRLNAYYPFPENQFGGYNTIWEKDSCIAKQHWFKYEKQWAKK